MVIPTAILFGLTLGRWWAVPVGGVAWAALVMSVGEVNIALAPATVVIGTANALVGLAIRRSFARLVRVTALVPR
jgi:hypothetical protein